jgi:hypothetical protein
MDQPSKQYWFPAKRYGWGWGIPSAWQGWVVMIAWLIILMGGAALTVTRGMAVHLLFILGTTAIFIAICYIKGEPPRWRWGGK